MTGEPQGGPPMLHPDIRTILSVHYGGGIGAEKSFSWWSPLEFNEAKKVLEDAWVNKKQISLEVLNSKGKVLDAAEKSVRQEYIQLDFSLVVNFSIADINVSGITVVGGGKIQLAH